MIDADGAVEMAVYTCHYSIKKHKSYQFSLNLYAELYESEFISLSLWH